MQYKKLGRTGLYVSRLCLGTMNFGDCTDKKSAFEILDRAADLGINFIDTADVYGGPQRPDIPLGYCARYLMSSNSKSSRIRLIVREFSRMVLLRSSKS